MALPRRKFPSLKEKFAEQADAPQVDKESAVQKIKKIIKRKK